MGTICCGAASISGPVTSPNQIQELQKIIENEVQNPIIKKTPLHINNEIDKPPITSPDQPVAVLDQNKEKSPNNTNEENNSNIIKPNEKIIPEKIDPAFLNDPPEPQPLALHIDLTNANQVINPDPKRKEERCSTIKSIKSPKKSIIQKNSKKNENNKKETKVINLEEIKLSEETTKKLKKLNENDQSHHQIKFSRSKTIANNDNQESEYEPTETKVKQPEEFKRNMVEDRKNLEKKQSEKNITKLKSLKNGEDNKNEGDASPIKGLLKRCKTIGDKKKVKFKDLDNKRRKKK